MRNPITDLNIINRNALFHLVKEYLRVLGIDDGPFNRDEDRKTVLVGVLMRFDFYIEGVMVREIEVDGTDSTEKIISMLRTHFSEDIDFIVSNGITFGGFNICNMNEIYSETGVPVVSITRKMPDINSMISAIEKHFEDSESRIGILNQYRIEKMEEKNGTSVYVNRAGISKNDAGELVNRMLIRGNIPEPVRVAHHIATAIRKGESYGRT